MDEDTRRAMIVGAGTTLVMVAWHIGLYPHRHQMEGTRRWIAYVIGTGTLLAGFGAWTRSPEQRKALRAFLLITGMSGAADIASWLIREQQGQQ